MDRYRVERRIKCRAEKDENGEPTGKRLATATDCMLEKNGEPQAKEDFAVRQIRSPYRRRVLAPHGGNYKVVKRGMAFYFRRFRFADVFGFAVAVRIRRIAQ